MIKLSEKQKGIIALVLLTILFASMGIFARYMKTSFTLLQQVYLRIGMAFLLSYIFFIKKIDLKKIKKINIKEWVLLIFRSWTTHLFGVSLFTYGILTTKYSNVSFIGALPLTALFGFILLKEKFSFIKLLYILLAFVGVVIIAVTDFRYIFYWGKGELITLISTVFFSLSYISRKWHQKLLNNYEITALIFLISFISIFTVSLIFKEGLPINNWSPFVLMIVVGAGLFNLGNLFLTNYGFERVEAVLASNLLTLEFLFAVIIGFLFFKELPNIKELIGGVLITFSVIQMNKL